MPSARQFRAYCCGTSLMRYRERRGTSLVRTVLCAVGNIDETARDMGSEYITKAQVLLQYYTALQELEEESRVMAAAAGAQAPRRIERIRQPIYLETEVRVSL